MRRESGILLSVSSLPSRYGIGCFSKEAYVFVDWLKEAGQSYWQILPLGPTSYGDSPYQSFSTFAGNPYYISLEDLIEEGVLTKEECDEADFGEETGSVDYERLYENRFPLLRLAYERSHVGESAEFMEFRRENGETLVRSDVFVKGLFFKPRDGERLPVNFIDLTGPEWVRLPFEAKRETRMVNTVGY